MESEMQRRHGRTHLLQRVVDKRRAAQSATCDEARLVHRQLARRYVAEARKARGRPPFPEPDEKGG